MVCVGASVLLQEIWLSCFYCLRRSICSLTGVCIFLFYCFFGLCRSMVFLLDVWTCVSLLCSLSGHVFSYWTFASFQLFCCRAPVPMLNVSIVFCCSKVYSKMKNKNSTLSKQLKNLRKETKHHTVRNLLEKQKYYNVGTNQKSNRENIRNWSNWCP